jgi:arabinose-5-phosphate isomerase
MAENNENKLNLPDEARRVLLVEARAIERMASRVGESFAQAVERITCCNGRVIVTGMGKSGIVGKKIAATLASTGTPAFFLHPGEASHGDLGMVTASDVIIAISNSGETEELVELIPFIKRFGVGLIAMTGRMDSSLGTAADVVLDVSVEEEACPMGIVPTASTTATLAMGDALAVALLKQRGFNEEDFAAYHPKGALGKKLLTKVSDLMHKDMDIPLVSPDTLVVDCLMEISSKRLGMAVVVEGSGPMQGIITDGDLRRGIERFGKDFFDKMAKEVMTREPKKISSSELAAKALAVMQEHAITSIVVLDGANKPEGVIHIHDILKQGIL